MIRRVCPRAAVGVWAASFVVMPDHIHIRLVLEPDSGEEPLRHVGQFVNNVKRWSRKHAAEIGVEVEWEPNYHDHICVSQFINEKVDDYIGYNSLTAEGLPCIKASPDPLKMVYRPHVDDTLAFAEGRLAVISRECSPDISRYDAWHGMNDAMAAMVAACGDGLGVYIHRKGARSAAAPVWERR